MKAKVGCEKLKAMGDRGGPGVRSRAIGWCMLQVQVPPQSTYLNCYEQGRRLSQLWWNRDPSHPSNVDL
jgi:hypothetical protein